MARFKVPLPNEQNVVRGTLETLLSPFHLARVIRRFLDEEVGHEELSVRYRNDKTGASAYDPLVMLGLWLLAMKDKVTSAVKLAELSQTVVEYRWMCGDVAPKRASLSSFRNSFGDELCALQARLVKSAHAQESEVGEDLLTDSTIIPAAGSRHQVRKVARLAKDVEKKNRAAGSDGYG